MLPADGLVGPREWSEAALVVGILVAFPVVVAVVGSTTTRTFERREAFAGGTSPLAVAFVTGAPGVREATLPARPAASTASPDPPPRSRRAGVGPVRSCPVRRARSVVPGSVVPGSDVPGSGVPGSGVGVPGSDVGVPGSGAVVAGASAGRARRARQVVRREVRQRRPRRDRRRARRSGPRRRGRRRREHRQHHRPRRRRVRSPPRPRHVRAPRLVGPRPRGRLGPAPLDIPPVRGHARHLFPRRGRHSGPRAHRRAGGSPARADRVTRRRRGPVDGRQQRRQPAAAASGSSTTAEKHLRPERGDDR
ncbi:hypothetical protein K7G98_10165 [Saccharothrix sp. MB29]|nr:hypothetical protein [Saccharothrix sp. MB29]